MVAFIPLKKIEYTYCELSTGKAARVLSTELLAENGRCIVFALLEKGGLESLDYLYPVDFYATFKPINVYE
jgi:hypothetical protein